MNHALITSWTTSNTWQHSD